MCRKRLIPSQPLWHKVKALVIFVLFCLKIVWRKRQALNICVGCLATNCMWSLQKQWVLIEFTLCLNWVLMAPHQCSMACLWEKTAKVLYCALCAATPALWERRSCQKLRTRAGIKLWLLQYIKCIRWDLTLVVVVHLRPLLWGVIRTHDTVLLNITDGCRPVSFSLRKLAVYLIFFLQKRYLLVCGKGTIKQIVILSLSAENWFKTDMSSVQPCRKGRAYLRLQLL